MLVIIGLMIKEVVLKMVVNLAIYGISIVNRQSKIVNPHD